MHGPCEHCGNADKSKWTTQCLYKGSWPSRRAFVLSTFDPPCACDDYDEGQRELSKSQNMTAAAVGIPVALAVVIIWFLFS